MVNYHNTILCGQRIKYGIIAESVFLKDLKDWNSFFIAGRMHKPTVLIHTISSEWKKMVMHAQSINLCNAINIVDKIYGFSEALSTSNPIYTMKIIEKIVQLSYLGDIRGDWAENPNKVRNIIKGQGDCLLKMYKEPMRTRHVHDLPGEFGRLDNSTDIIALIKSLNRRSSLLQSIKGPCTIGFGKSIKYFLEKLRKSRLT